MGFRTHLMVRGDVSRSESLISPAETPSAHKVTHAGPGVRTCSSGPVIQPRLPTEPWGQHPRTKSLGLG